MMRRRWLRLFVVLSLASLGCESEAERIEARLSELAAELPLRPGESEGARKRRIQSQLEPALDDEFRLDAPWLGVDTDRAFALVSAVAIERVFPLLDLDVDDMEVSLSESGRRAWVRGNARASSAQTGDLHAFTLGFELDLRKVGAEWLLVRLALQDPAQPLPEARP